MFLLTPTQIGIFFQSWNSERQCIISISQFISSVVQSCPTLCNSWTAARQVSLSITNSRSPPKPMSIESVMPSNHLIFCCPLLLPSIFSSIRGFSNESALRIRCPKYWSFSFNVSPSNEHPGLTSFRMDWLGLSNTTVQRHQFFTAQLSLESNTHPYMATGKTIALTRRTFVDRVMSLLFNMLSKQQLEPDME